MPSPFPGVDPFIEGQKWPDFHHELVSAIRQTLVQRLRPRYEVSVEERVYVEHEAEDGALLRPDVSVMEGGSREAFAEPSAQLAVAVAAAPVVLTLPMPERKREAFLSIRHRTTMEVVSIIEVLLPANKRLGGDGRREYLNKRESVLQSATHLVELDLLRGGQRLPTIEPLPPGDYYAFVARGTHRPRVEVYAWALRSRLLAIPVPLAGNDPDVAVDLQQMFNSVYDRAGYDYSLDYRRATAG